MSIKTLAATAADLASGAVTSVELTQDCLTRIDASEHNAFISTLADHALAQASEADTLRKNGDQRALLGIPIAQKDIFCIDGSQTTCGSKILENFIAPYTATVVQNMHDAGLVSIGRTNMDEFVMGSSNQNSFFGRV